MLAANILKHDSRFHRKKEKNKNQTLSSAGEHVTKPFVAIKLKSQSNLSHQKLCFKLNFFHDICIEFFK